MTHEPVNEQILELIVDTDEMVARAVAAGVDAFEAVDLPLTARSDQLLQMSEDLTLAHPLGHIVGVYGAAARHVTYGAAAVRAGDRSEAELEREAAARWVQRGKELIERLRP